MKRSLIFLGFLLAALLAACSTPIPRSGSEGEPYPVEEYRPGVPGEVRTFRLADGSSFEAAVKDGLVVFEGDIVLGTVDEVATLSGAGLGPLSNSCDYDRWWCDKWPNKIVYYEIASPERAPSGVGSLENVVQQALQEIEAKTNLLFVRDSRKARRIVFHSGPDGDGCYSDVGTNRNGTARAKVHVWLEAPTGRAGDRHCYFKGIAVHETLHALGFYHEQTRDDRSDHVRILWDNIQSGKKHNFENPDGWLLNFNDDIGPYDFGSIMHYPCTAFAKRPGLRTLEPKDPGVSCSGIGQRIGMSDGDVLGVLSIYDPNLTLSAPNDLTRDRPLTGEVGGEYDRDTEAVEPHVKWYFDGVQVGASNRSLSLPSWEYAAGPHTLEAVVEISGVELDRLTQTVTLENVAPAVVITQPGSTGPYCQNETVTLRALASDADTAPYFTSGNVNDRVDWIYDRDPADALAGVLFASNTATTTYTLSDLGTVRFTARVDDADGATARASLDLTVQACTNTPPQVAIAHPASDLDVWAEANDANGWYYEITLQGTASDAEDGPLTGSWYTNRGDAQPGGPASGTQLLGTGNTLTVRLYTFGSDPVTTHEIRFVAVDSDGNTRTATVLITVNQLI